MTRRLRSFVLTLLLHLSRVVVPTLWAGGIVAGFWSLEQYKSIEGRTEAAVVEGRLLGDTTDIERSRRSRLVMYVHPHCPCTRASLAELAQIVAARSDVVTAEVVVVAEPGMDPAWRDGAIMRAAAELKGVRVRTDETGDEARRAGAYTSGQTLLFAADGDLLFRGGITRSRGHVGESAGTRAVNTLLSDATLASIARTESMTTPVFGCSLFKLDACHDAACRTGP